jgi:hypothetical protein
MAALNDSTESLSTAPYMPTLERLKAVGGLKIFQKDAKWCIVLHFECKFISLLGMFNEMKLISPCCLKYVVIM